MSNNYTKLSKYLSMILRHKPEVIGMSLDKNGWCNIDELLIQMNKHGKVISREILEEIVRTDNKGRYAISNDKQLIRANQGHSIHVDLELEATIPPDVLYHGTVKRFLDSIMKEGLLKMDRQYVHLSSDIATAIKVAERRGKPVILRIDSRRMNDRGYIFYLSKNGVWLCDHIPSEFLAFNGDYCE